MRELMIGTSAYPSAEAGLLQQAGMRWVRHGFGVPFVDRVEGEVTEEYRKKKAQAQERVAAGLRVLGVTPLPGVATRKPDANGRLVETWRDHLPAWCGPLGSEQFLQTYEATCRWLAADLRGIVSAWQIANELDISVFAGPLTPRQACDLIARAARGLKSADPALVVGHNPAGAPKAYYFFGYLYAQGDGPFDYCGIDGYYGTWAPGGPQDWAPRIAELHELTGLPVLVNEWGFSSAGDVMTEEEQRAGLGVCEARKWRHAWGAGHTPEGQAQFVAAAFDAFVAQRDALLGVFFYRWEDQERCWQCGSPACPAETAWGLVDLAGRPKPAFHAFQEGVRRLPA